MMYRDDHAGIAAFQIGRAIHGAARIRRLAAAARRDESLTILLRLHALTAETRNALLRHLTERN